MTPLQILFSSILALTAVLALAIPLWKAKHRYSLRWAILETKSLLEVADEIASHISITYSGKIIKDITKYSFVLHNSGHTPIDSKDIVVPVVWKGPGKVLSALVVASKPTVELYLKTDENEVEISWPLFNQKCMALIEILCEGGSTDKIGKITGQIRNIPAIEEKRISVADEAEQINQMKSRMQLLTPNFLQSINQFFLNKFFLNKWALKSNRYFIAIYVGGLPLFISFIFLGYFPGNNWIIGIGVLFTFFTLFITIRGFRNPYSHLLEIAKQRKG